ncbi:uncharacterized protein LOC112452362 isoform X2 [Temnothorax curvispinosus]|nr:uncharacterized protein LOC112452362 isoform X2 [Temnothorax curvispinosus]
MQHSTTDKETVVGADRMIKSAPVRLSEKMNTKLRSGYITMEQKETLVELMKQNSELKSSKFSSTFTTKDAQRMWIALAEELHKIPNGAIKDWKQWRKTWQDLCSKTKAKHSQISKYMKGTGGGPALLPSEQLTSTEQQVLETINATAISGLDNIAETEAVFEYEGVEYLDEYQEISDSEGPEATVVEAMSTNNNEATTCNMQNSSTKNQIMIVVNKENKVMAINNKENRNKIVKNTPMTERNTKTCNTKQGHIKQNEPHKQTVASHRFEKTMEYTNDLVGLTAKDQQMRKKYYRKKLKLMLRDVTVKERMATALENISNVYPFIKD